VSTQTTTLMLRRGGLAATKADRSGRTAVPLRSLRAVALALVVPVALLTFWHAMVRVTATRLVPAPFDVAITMWDFAFGGVYDDAFSASLPVHLVMSAQRVYGGFALAAATAIPLGLLIGRLPLLRAMVDPTISLLRPIPVTAWLPLSMIFFGLGPRAAVFLVFLGAFYPILFNTVFGVRSVDMRLLEAAAMLGARGPQLFGSVILPATLPSIFNGLRLGLGFAWILIVVGEMTGVSEGLGAVIMDGRTLSRTDLVIAGMIVIGVCGFLSDRVIVLVNNRVLRWSPQHHA